MIYYELKEDVQDYKRFMQMIEEHMIQKHIYGDTAKMNVFGFMRYLKAKSVMRLLNGHVKLKYKYRKSNFLTICDYINKVDWYTAKIQKQMRRKARANKRQIKYKKSIQPLLKVVDNHTFKV